MLVLNIDVLTKVRTADGASSVEVFFVDAELVGDEFDGSRFWVEHCIFLQKVLVIEIKVVLLQCGGCTSRKVGASRSFFFSVQCRGQFLHFVHIFSCRTLRTAHY